MSVMLNGLRILMSATLLLLSANAADASAVVGDPIPIPSGPELRPIKATSSDAGHGAAIALDGRVLYQDSRRRWHRFDIQRGTVRLAQLENGGGLAVWSSGPSTLSAREWHGDGRLEPVQSVLTGITPTYLSSTGEYDQTAWAMADDGRGRVVIAAPGDPAHPDGVYAVTRERDAAFSAQQQLQAPSSSPYSHTHGASVVRVSPLAADGTVTVSWSPWLNPATDLPGLPVAGNVTRAGRAGSWSAPTSSLPAHDSAVLVADHSRVVRVGAGIRGFCRQARLGCDAQLFTWKDGTRLLALRHAIPDNPGHQASNEDWGAGDGWYTARPDAHGRFDHPISARIAGDGPLRTSRAGTIGFLAYGDGLNLLPIGVKPKLPPHVYLRHAELFLDALSFELACRATCRLAATARVLHGSRAVGRRYTARGSASGSRLLRRPLSPFVYRSLRVDVPRDAERVRLTLTARDARGRTTRLIRTISRTPD